MSTKKTATKKTVAKKTAVKKTAPKKEVSKKTKVSLVSFEVTAVIPTQQYGNLQPKITVTAPSMEEAREEVMPMIEDMYKKYAESTPHFLGRVTQTEKVVKPTPQPAPEAPKPAPQAPEAPQPAPTPTEPPQPAQEAPQPAQEAPQPAQTEQTARPEAEKSAPVMKAEKAISLATSHDALALIENQVNASVKIDPSEKPDLLRQITERRNEIPF